MEGSIYNAYRVLQANSYVLWNDKLPATFQAIMNEILRDLNNEGKVAAFVDDVLVGTETKEGHDEIVEEILRRLEENNLYIKPENAYGK